MCEGCRGAWKDSVASEGRRAEEEDEEEDDVEDCEEDDWCFF